MAVTAEAIASRLKLQLITGVDPEGKPIKRSRSYSGIKPAAVHQDVLISAAHWSVCRNINWMLCVASMK